MILTAISSFLFSTSVAAFRLKLSPFVVRLHGLTQVSQRTLSACGAKAPLWLGNTRVRSDKDACWRGLRKPLLARRWLSGIPRQQGFSLGRKPVCPGCWNLRCPFSPLCRCIQSLICSFQPVLLMSVLCYSLIEKFGNGHRLWNILLYLASQLWKSDFFFLSCVIKNLLRCMDERSSHSKSANIHHVSAYL